MKYRHSILLLFVALLTSSSAVSSGYTNVGTRPGAGIRTVIIDAGHGGKDAGARGSFSLEKNVSLAIALKLGRMIEENMPDVKVVYTRTTDELPGNLDDVKAALRERANIANKAKGDLFISIHCNSSMYKVRRLVGHRTVYVKNKKGRRVRKTVPVYRSYEVPSNATGTETYIWAVGKNAQKTAALKQNNAVVMFDENSADSIESITPDSPESAVMIQMMSSTYFNHSLTLAGYVQEEFQKVGRLNRDVRQRDEKGIWVLQATAMPSILVETGFISNPEDERYINSAIGQKEITDCIFRAFKRYKDDLEKNRTKKG